MVRLLRFALRAGVGISAIGLGTLQIVPKYFETRRIKQSMKRPKASQQLIKLFSENLPTRAAQLKALETEQYDVLVIGGGATGCGVALDAVTRGLKTALVERYDFSSGTSSRSTKLLHGGVRYLEKAIFNLDRNQYEMVQEALEERAHVIKAAPHIAHCLPIMLPIYKWYQVPKFWLGIKLYDLISGSQVLKCSYFVNKAQALEFFPMLKSENLVGAMVYYDGQQNDSRMCLSLALTATRFGAAISNYTEVKQLVKKGGKVVGAVIEDSITKKKITVKANCVVNATGAYTDLIRTMDDKAAKKICQPSSGVHIALPRYFTPAKMGLIDPSSSDGRVIFILPWLDSTIAGTTDAQCELTNNPGPTEADINFILRESRKCLSSRVSLKRGDVQSAWSGLRPLVMDPTKSDTQSLARSHFVEVSPAGLVTIAGGKWTTYRSMAEETVDAAIQSAGLAPKLECCTKIVQLEGTHQYGETLFIELVQKFGLHPEVADHLAKTYGDKATSVAKLAAITHRAFPVSGVRLHPDYPYIEAEVVWACQEYACRAVDVLAWRTRLAHQNVHASFMALPRIVELMAGQLGWNAATREKEFQYAMEFLVNEVGTGAEPPPRKHAAKKMLSLSRESLKFFGSKFAQLDFAKKGRVPIQRIKEDLLKEGSKADHLDYLINEVDVIKNGEMRLGEYLYLMLIVRDGYTDVKSKVDNRKSGEAS